MSGIYKDGEWYGKGSPEMPAEDMPEVASPMPSVMSRRFKYSTEEQIVGEWIDGKKLYQKTIDFGALPNATSKTVNHGISDLDYVVNYTAVAENTTSHSRLFLPFIDPSNVSGGISVNIPGNSSVVQITTGQDRSSWNKTYVTIQYTKTTD